MHGETQPLFILLKYRNNGTDNKTQQNTCEYPIDKRHTDLPQQQCFIVFYFELYKEIMGCLSMIRSYKRSIYVT
ncbi:hypothetical protein Xsto_03085 [Xenorhabdus stockiae]|uniref:Uncharacterized protein n=1 Tax=Xenorhabdus stockiae TaxID=351614 RepID=A0A2D0KLR8_9GAMM|nr:hypothetical protein Xekk_00309 [Xenorhabdus sp. KK7.4]PHM64328.1 hypothetical protein Xsto_03085 [Xenorhabdus stockiae]PHM71798.1 hypothetical protein Xekj_01035 [Xenorhabdus sp. KJ12.1]